MRRFLAASIALGAMVPMGCAASVGPTLSPGATPGGDAIRYVALGDSYTIGTSIAEGDRWPNQLVAALRGRVPLELVANLGVNGYSSGDLISAELPPLADLRPEFVSILIGVNDVVRDVPVERYRANVEQILGAVLALVPRDRIVVVATPDYTRTPRGADFGDPQQQRDEIAAFNALMADMCAERGIAFVDITPVADLAGTDRTLVAGDLLHPSGEQYRRWVELIAPVVIALFSD